MSKKTRLERDLIHKLSKMACFGQSKHQAKRQARAEYIAKNGSTKGFNPSKVENKVFSLGTMRAYREALHSFSIYCKNNDIKRINQITSEICKQYLQQCVADKKSNWTISRDMSAINKVFNYDLTKENCNLPKRRLEDITRSRGGPPAIGDSNKYAEHLFFIQSTGARKQSVTTITPAMFQMNEKGLCYTVKLREKGGKERVAPVLVQHREKLTGIVNRALWRENGDTKPIFDSFDKNLGIAHSLRSQYAVSLLNGIESGLYEHEWLPYSLSERDKQGGDAYRGHDKIAMAQVSFALG